jgi:3-hydroxyacyl-[acyl-carrier-protein] dehydratase
MRQFPEVSELIPHRPPFLWVDRIVAWEGQSIITEKFVPMDLDILTGHYPNMPILPGVLLCEAVFQSGALLIALSHRTSDSLGATVPVLTRISAARFKRSAYPGDTLRVSVRQTEALANVAFFKGNLTIAGKSALQVEFACARVTADQAAG